MYSVQSFQLRKDEFNYLLPVLRHKLHQKDDRCYFIANNIEDLTDMLNRLKGHYDSYDELKNMVVFNCSKNGSLNPFRESILKKFRIKIRTHYGTFTVDDVEGKDEDEAFDNACTELSEAILNFSRLEDAHEY